MSWKKWTRAGAIALLLACGAGIALDAAAQVQDVLPLDVNYERPPKGQNGLTNWNFNNINAADPVPDGVLWLVHALISTMGGDRNGADAVHLGAQAFEWGKNDNYKRYSGWTYGMDDILLVPDPNEVGQLVVPGNGLPDRWEFAVFEYAYTTPGAPHHEAARAAWDFNLNSIANWTQNNNPCSDSKPEDFPRVEGEPSWPIGSQPWPGYAWKVERPADFPEHLWNPGDGYNSASPPDSAWPHVWDPTLKGGAGDWAADPPWWSDRTWFTDVAYGDLFGSSGFNPNVFGGTCNNDKYDHFGLRVFAGHATISDDGVGPYSYITGMWSYFNQMRENPIDFNNDPRIDRSVVQYFGANGNANGDALTNRQKYESYRRAWEAGWRPQGYDTPEGNNEGQRDRTRADIQMGAYINFVLFYNGCHPFDPECQGPPPPTNFRVVAQTQSQWFEALPDKPLELSVTVANAEGEVTYQWYKDGVALSDSDPHYSGVQTANLTVHPPLSKAVDAGNYWCVMSDESEGKATISSAPIEITIFAEGELPAAGAFGLGVLGSVLALAALRRFRR